MKVERPAAASPSARPDVAAPDGEGYLPHCAEAFKRAVAVPVISVGGYRTAATMQAVLRQGKADLVSISRPLVRSRT